MMAHRQEANAGALFEHGFGRRPEQQLFDVINDPGCRSNLAGVAAHESTRKSMRAALEKALTGQKDPRLLGNGDIWESYPRFSPMRPELGGFAEEGKSNPRYRRRH
jgi:N-sulfoglucosamine sulfohydrolase